MLKNVSRIYQAVGAVNDYLEGKAKYYQAVTNVKFSKTFKRPLWEQSEARTIFT